MNREQLGSLCSETREALRIFDGLRKKNPKNLVIGGNDFCPPMHYLYKGMYESRKNERVFVLSKNIEKRIDYVNSDHLVTSPDGLKMLFKKDEVGYIISNRIMDVPGINPQTGEKSDSGVLNCAYMVKDGKFYMQIWSGIMKDGYLVYDLDSYSHIAFIPYSVISMDGTGQWPQYDNDKTNYKTFLLDMLKKDYPDGIDINKIKRSNAYKKKKSAKQIDMHLRLLAGISWMFNAFVFLKTSEVYSQEYIPDPTPTYRRKKGYKPLNYTFVDTTWDMNIDVNTPFPVRGHFKMQACKIDGKWDHKLIYIEQYMKSGYHRRAKKIIHGDI